MPQGNGEATSLEAAEVEGRGHRELGSLPSWSMAHHLKAPGREVGGPNWDGEGRTQDQRGREGGLLAVTGAAAPLPQLT